MKQIIKNFFKDLISDRYIFVMSILIIIISIICAINIGLSIVPSDIKIVSHYSAFGISNYYTDNWVYLINFMFFGIVVAILHVIISVKLLIAKGHSVAVMFIWSGVGVIMVGWVIFQHVLNVLK
jgi:hypothetical protein